MKLDFSRDWVFMFGSYVFWTSSESEAQMNGLAYETQWRLFEYSKTAETSLDRAGQFGKRSQKFCDKTATTISCRWRFLTLDYNIGCWRQKWLPTYIVSYIRKHWLLEHHNLWSINHLIFEGFFLLGFLIVMLLFIVGIYINEIINSWTYPTIPNPIPGLGRPETSTDTLHIAK